MQSINPEPGQYYVTALDVVSNAGHVRKCYFMAGPFETHTEALDLVEQVKSICLDHDPRGIGQWLSWGTTRWTGDPDKAPEGRANQFLETA